MERTNVTLMMLALAEGAIYSPVQIQKAMFLADDKVRDAFEEDSRYNFQPFDYGPFDRDVYLDVQFLQNHGLARIGTSRDGWNTYAVTEEGIERSRVLRRQLSTEQLRMLRRISIFVRSLSFSELVSAIYRGYPHMRERSVFRE
jgi:hypothetical protein